MKFSPNKKDLSKGSMALLVIILSICFYYLLFNGTHFSSVIKSIFQIFMPVTYGFIFAYLLTPVVNRLESRVFLPCISKLKFKNSVKKQKIARGLTILITIIVVIWAIYSFFALVIPELISSIRNISVQLPIFVRNTTNWVNKFLADNPDIRDFIRTNLPVYSDELQNFLNTNILPQMETVFKSVTLSVMSLLQVLWNFLIGIIISCYVLFNKELFAGQCKKILYALFKSPTANNIIQSFRFTNKTFSGFIGGKILDSLIIGLLCFIGVSLLQMPHAVLISVIVGVTNVIPFFGPYIGAIPSAFLIFMISPIKCLYFLIFILVLQQFDGNVLGPRILGESTGLSGFWVIFSITIFGGLFGIIGMIIGVPFFAVLYTIVRSYVNKKLSHRGLPDSTLEYMDVSTIEDNYLIKLNPEDKKTPTIPSKNTESPK